MDPVSVVSVVFGCVGLADVMTRAGFGLRQLQAQFNGALDHVDMIVQQTSTVDLALREICSLLRHSPHTFPSPFQSRLKEIVDAIGAVTGHIEEHTKLVQDEAEESPIQAKLLHLRQASKVEQWEKTLGTQIQVLSLLLHIASLRTSGERMSVLEQDSTCKLFEKASSMSAKIGISSHTSSTGKHCSPDEVIQSFSFDPLVLQSKVYRRHCESVFRRQVSMNSQDIADLDPSASTSSISSDNAVMGSSAVSHKSLGSIGERDPDETELLLEGRSKPLALQFATSEEAEEHGRMDESSRLLGLLPEGSTVDTTRIEPTELQLSTGSSVGTAQTETFDTELTESSLATTISSHLQPLGINGCARNDDGSANESVIAVTVDAVGDDQVRLPARQPDYYNVIRNTIFKVRESLLSSRGIPPNTSTGAMVSTTIEGFGQTTETFRFTEPFLQAALEVLDDGGYYNIRITARFSAPLPHDPDTNTARVASPQSGGLVITNCPDAPDVKYASRAARASSTAPHYFCGPKDAVPFYNQFLIAKGGFGEVSKVCLHQKYLQGLEDYAPNAKFAVKRLVKGNAKDFQREADILRHLASAQQPHIVKLLSTIEHRRETAKSDYYLLFPLAECNLQEYWERANIIPNPPRVSAELLPWVQQFARLADALRAIHGDRTQVSDNSKILDRNLCGRHGDIKPANILVYRESNKSVKLVLADFGISRLHSRSSKLTSDSRNRIPCTATYRAPEYDLDPPRISQAIDIWSFGCVMLEFITWYLLGPDGTRKFNAERRENTRDGAFFIRAPSGEVGLNPAVEAQFAGLGDEISKLNPPPIRNGLLPFLTPVVACLDVDQHKRPSAETLAKELRRLSTGWETPWVAW